MVDVSKKRFLIRQVGAEVFGTFALTFVAAAMASVVLPERDGHARQAAATGLTVLALTYTVSDLSGAHINPAVSLAFTLRKAFPWPHMLAYWLGQLAGGVAAAALAAAVTGRRPGGDLCLARSGHLQ
jgi:aquaporin Z